METEYSAFEAPRLTDAPSGAPAKLPPPIAAPTHLPTPVPPPPSPPPPPPPPPSSPPPPPSAAVPPALPTTLPAPVGASFAPPSGTRVEVPAPALPAPAFNDPAGFQLPAPAVPDPVPVTPAVLIDAAVDPAVEPEVPTARRPASTWRRRIPIIVGFVLIIAAIALGVQAVREFGAANDAAPVDDTTRPASPILEPIGDAQDVVDDINGTADEALGELGLDPTGRPMPLGYRFTTIDSTGTSLTVTVDTTNGNFAIDGDNGSAFRSMSDNVVTRLVATDPWTPIDPGVADAIQPFGLDRALEAQDVLPAAVRPFTTVDDTAAGIFRLDYASATAAEPDVMAAWADEFGIDFLSETLLVTVQSNDSGFVEFVTIAAPEEPPVFSYLLDELYDSAPRITL